MRTLARNHNTFGELSGSFVCRENGKGCFRFLPRCGRSEKPGNTGFRRNGDRPSVDLFSHQQFDQGASLHPDPDPTVGIWTD